MRRVSRLVQVLLLVLLLLPTSSCAHRHRSLAIGRTLKPGRIPVRASWQGIALREFTVEGLDARNYFSTFRNSPAQELDAAVLADLKRNDVFDSIAKSDLGASIAVSAEFSRFHVETSVFPLAGMPGLGILTIPFPQTELAIDIVLSVRVTSNDTNRRVIAAATSVVSEKKWINMVNKRNLDEELSRVFAELGDQVKNELVRQGRVILDAAASRKKASAGSRYTSVD